jgi:hypothetical protein
LLTGFSGNPVFVALWSALIYVPIAVPGRIPAGPMAPVDGYGSSISPSYNL